MLGRVTVWPVIERELRAATRKPWTMGIRPAFALAGVVTCGVVLAVPGPRASEQGVMMLGFLAMVCAILVLASGCFLTADCVSREKRDQTLGLLFLTPLRSADILSGKLVSNSVQVLYGVLAVFPVFFLPLLNGGVTWWEVLRVLLALMVLLLLSLTCGLFFSVVTVQAKTAVLATFIFLLALTLLPFLLAVLQAEVFRHGQVLDVLTAWLSPMVLVITAFEEAWRNIGSTPYAAALGLQGGMAVGFWVVAVLLLPRRRYETETLGPRQCRVEGGVRRGRAVAGEERSSDPYAWRTLRGAGEPTWLRGVRYLVLGIFWVMLLMAVLARDGDVGYGTAMAAAYVMHLLAKLLLALEATRQLHGDRRSGALELLLVTPWPSGQILGGAQRAVRRSTRVLYRCQVWVNLALLGLILFFGRQVGVRGDDVLVFGTIFLGGWVMAAVDRAALEWVGFRQGLRCATHLKAALTTVVIVMLPGWVLFGLLMVPFSKVNSAGGAALLFLFWFALCGTYAVVATVLSRAGLRARFRRIVAG